MSNQEITVEQATLNALSEEFASQVASLTQRLVEEKVKVMVLSQELARLSSPSLEPDDDAGSTTP